MTRGMKKSSKQKQRLYIKYLKNKIEVSENTYKNYKNIFEKLRKKSKQPYYSSLIEKYKYNSKKTWEVMKEITGKKKNKFNNNLPKVLKTERGVIHDQKKIAHELNKFFTNIGQNLANKIPTVQKSFETYLTRNENLIDNTELSFEEFEDAFQSLQRNKACGIDDINCNIIIDSYDEIKQPLFQVLKNSINDGIFPDSLKIAKVSPIFKSGDTSLLGNYRPISVLPVFSKIIERIMYNRLYSFFNNNNLFFSKQFGFQKNTSTEHAILHLTNEISKAFAKKEFTIGVFIDLSKAYDTVNHGILLKKLEIYGIRGTTIKWLRSYLENRKQYISFNKHSFTDFCNIICGVPQGTLEAQLGFVCMSMSTFFTSDLTSLCPKVSEKSTFPFWFMVIKAPLWLKVLTKQLFSIYIV